MRIAIYTFFDTMKVFPPTFSAQTKKKYLLISKQSKNRSCCHFFFTLVIENVSKRWNKFVFTKKKKNRKEKQTKNAHFHTSSLRLATVFPFSNKQKISQFFFINFPNAMDKLFVHMRIHKVNCLLACK